MKLIKIQKDKITGEYFISLNAFKKLVDITKIKSYSLETVLDCGVGKEGENVALLIKFFDAKGNLIEAKYEE